jgi:NAD(P)-dependent dehydrogenase (short-subunit alcohol dehydrogenase family)
MGRLDDKVALITGAATGMGAATAERFVAEGARVVICDLKEDEGGALAERLGDAAVFLRTDVTQEEDVATAVAVAKDRWGRLDCMFNNAGFGGALGPIDQTSEDDFDITFDVLLKGVFFGIKHAALVMKPQQSGSIINTASVAGLQAGWGPHLYNTAKAAVIQLSRSTALELGEHGVRVNCICPGVIATPLAMGKDQSPEALAAFKKALGAGQPIGRVGEPDDIANAALWLASDESSFVTGEAMVVDGGVQAGRPWARVADWIREPNPIRLYRPPGR